MASSSQPWEPCLPGPGGAWLWPLPPLLSLNPLRNDATTRDRLSVRGRNIAVTIYTTGGLLKWLCVYTKIIIIIDRPYIKYFNLYFSEHEGKYFLWFPPSKHLEDVFVPTGEKCCVLLTAFWLCLVFNELLQQCWECCRTVLQRMVPQIGPFETVRKLLTSFKW